MKRLVVRQPSGLGFLLRGCIGLRGMSGTLCLIVICSSTFSTVVWCVEKVYGPLIVPYLLARHWPQARAAAGEVTGETAGFAVVCPYVFSSCPFLL